MTLCLAVDIIAFGFTYTANEFRPMPMLPPLFISAVMVSKSDGGEKRGGDGDDGGLGFHDDFSGGELADGEM